MIGFVLLTVVIFCSTENSGGALLRQPARLDGRIVGGVDVNIEQFPHQLSLQSYGTHYCGASILSPLVAVTAAHCTQSAQASILTVRAGTTTKGIGGVVVQVKEIIMHEDYDARTMDYDIALLILEEALPLSNKIRAVKLPKQGQDLSAGSPTIVTGWGAITEGGSTSAVLQMVTIAVIGEDDCETAYDALYAITPRMVCAGVWNIGGKDACQGDSGGPMTSDGTLHGIVSWGKGCARKEFPGVYTRVSSVRDWIQSKTGV